MKAFAITTLTLLAAIFTLNRVADPSSMLTTLNPRLTEAIIDQNPKKCVLDAAVLSSTRTSFLSQWLLDHGKSETAIVVGTSRVQALRINNFVPKNFINFGAGGTNAEDYPRIVDLLRSHPQIKTVLISVDIWDFVKTGGYRIYDVLTSFKNPWLRNLSTKFLRIYVNDGSSYRYPSVLERAWSVFVEDFSYGATKRTFTRLWKEGRLTQKFFEIPLPPGSAIQSKCILSTTPEFNRNGAVGIVDTSIYTPEELLGLPLKSDRGEFTKESVTKAGTHWRLYDPMAFSKEFSTFRLSYMDYLLSEASKINVVVVGYEPPFPKAVSQIMQEIGLGPMWAAFDKKMKDLFNQYGYRFISGEETSCPDAEFEDAWHPWAECMNRIFPVFKQREPRLAGSP